MHTAEVTEPKPLRFIHCPLDFCNVNNIIYYMLQMLIIILTFHALQHTYWRVALQINSEMKKIHIYTRCLIYFWK